MNGPAKTYDSAFLTGVALNCFLFLALNLRSFENTTSNDPEAIVMSGYSDPIWGFPFRMVNGGLQDWGYAALGNFALFIVSGFAFGFISHVIWAEIVQSFSSTRRR